MRTYAVPLWLCSTLAMGCKGPPEAPEELNELAGFLFERFNDENVDDIALGVHNLEVWLQGNLDATEGDSVRDGYSVSALRLEVLQSVRPESEPVADGDIAGSAVATQSMFPVRDIARATTVEEQEDVFPSMVSHDRTFLTDKACFVPRTCEFLETDNFVESDFGSLNTSTHSRAEFRWLDYGVDGEKTAVLQRTWLEAPAETTGLFGDFLEVNEQIYLGVTIPWEGGAVRLGTTWVAVKILLDIDQDFALNQMVNAMKKDGEAIDTYLAAE